MDYCSITYNPPPILTSLNLKQTTTPPGAFAHPSYLTEAHFEKVKLPLLLSCAETDMTFPTPSRTRAVEILTERKIEYYLQVFSGVGHGFAIRGDMTKGHERKCF